jgi:acetylornithine deacetylase
MSKPSAQSIEMIERVIAFPTVSRDSNLNLIEFIRDYLSGLGVQSHLTYDEDGRKANLYATLGPTDRPGIMLSGHTDVVPVDGQAWDSDPFQVVEKDGRLYGRGTSDMKTFIALALAKAPEFLERGLETPIHFAFSYDEEVGCLGVRGLIDALKHLDVMPKLCIVGEPTEMQVVNAHKGKHSFTCTVRGLEAHSSLTHAGVNAVEAGAEIVAFIKRLARRKRDHGPFDADFTPPYTTIQTGTFEGGTAVNIVALDARFLFEWRFLPDDDPDELLAEIEAFIAEEILPEMHAVSKDTGVTIERISYIPGLSTAADSDVVALAKALSGANDTIKVSFGTEGGLFQEAGIPSIVCGPGSIEQAHKPNEFITLDQVAKGEAFMDRLMERVCAK